LVQTVGATIPTSVLPTTVTTQGNIFNGPNQLLKLGIMGELPNALNITQQGNTFNNANQLIKLDASGNLGIGNTPINKLTVQGLAGNPTTLGLT
jgi:hypothetical protein